MTQAYIYQTSEFTTSSGVVNYDSLRIEILASPISGLVSVSNIAGEVQLKFSVALDLTDLGLLDAIVADHDGEQPIATSALMEKRQGVFFDILNMAHNHPTMKLDEDMISSYTRYIHDYVNNWIFDGNHTVLVDKIAADSLAGQPYETFLNQIVDAEGSKAFEFFIASIPTTPYI